jgi:hypothetical protein
MNDFFFSSSVNLLVPVYIKLSHSEAILNTTKVTDCFLLRSSQTLG